MRQWKSFKRDDASINTILDMLFGYQKSRVLLTACELNLFTVIGTDNKAAEEIAIELNLEKRAADRLLSSLCALGLLEKSTGKYMNTKVSLRYLVKSKPEFMNIMDYNIHMWDKWSQLTEVVRLGKPIDFKSIKDYDENMLEAFLNMVNWRSRLLAPEIVKSVPTKGVSKFLDLSSGTGDYAIEMKLHNPDIDSTIFTYPTVKPYVIHNVKSDALLDKINIVTGDYLTDDIGSGYDMVFLSFVMHYHTIWDNIKLARRVYDAMNPGGKIVIQDYFVSDDRTKPDYNALFALEMLVNSDGGDTFTGSDMWIILKEAWFNKVEKIDNEYGISIVTATK